MKRHQSNMKKIAMLGAIFGFVAAGLQTRRLTEENDPAATAKGLVALTLSDWKEALVGVKEAIGEKNLPALAAGVAYYSTLAFFPLLAAIVAIAALLITPAQLEGLIEVSAAYLPEDISRIIASQLQNLVGRRSDNLLAATIAIAIALYGASGASKSLVMASNVVYGKKETRGWILQQLTGVGWTCAGIVLGFIVLLLMAVNKSVLLSLSLPAEIVPVLLYGRWIIVLLLTVSGIAVFYRYAPHRHSVLWRWVVVGAGVATIVWLLATGAFFAYLQSFANYTQSYSLFAGIIALMVWMNLSALILLAGAELNHQLELRSRRSR